MKTMKPAVMLIDHRDLTLDVVNKKLYKGGEPIHITKTTYNLLEVLATKPGFVWKYDDLMEEFWCVSRDALKMQLVYLRRLLGRDYIRTVYKVGVSLR